MVQKFPKKVSGNPEIVEFPKSQPFNRKFQGVSQTERNIQARNFRKFRYTPRGISQLLQGLAWLETTLQV